MAGVIVVGVVVPGVLVAGVSVAGAEQSGLDQDLGHDTEPAGEAAAGGGRRGLPQWWRERWQRRASRARHAWWDPVRGAQRGREPVSTSNELVSATPWRGVG